MGSVAETSIGEAQLYERNSELVFRYCLRMLRSREEAEDASQTTFVQALRALRRGVVPSFEQAWLLTIAKNECRSRYRAASRRKQLELVRDPQALEEVAEARPPGDDMLIGVQAALTRMPEMQRRALLLREWQGHSYAEIARELSLSQGAVEALLFRARKSLAKQLGEEQKGRRHAFDLASLLGGLKSLLAGGTAVKAGAVGVAAVASVSVAVGRSYVVPAPVPAEKTPVAVAPARDSEASVARPARTIAASTSRTSPRKDVTPGARAATPTRRASTPQPVKATAPVVAPTTSPQAPSSPAPPATKPTAPPTPAAPEVPKLQAPQPPALPVDVPQVPALPPLPPAPPLPQAPDLPLPDVQLPDVPDLPKLP
jgi:RNA polymerase sigma factor (sigma-70 family)